MSSSGELEQRPENRAPCYFFQQGTCKKGVSCRFSHSTKRGRESVDYPLNSAKKNHEVTFQTHTAAETKLPSSVAIQTPCQWIAQVRDKHCPPTSYSAESRSSLCIVMVHSDGLFSEFTEHPSSFRIVYAFTSVAQPKISNLKIVNRDAQGRPCFLCWFQRCYTSQTPAAIIYLDGFSSEGSVSTLPHPVDKLSINETPLSTQASISSFSERATTSDAKLLRMQWECETGHPTTLGEVICALIAGPGSKCPIVVVKIPKFIAPEDLCNDATVVVNSELSSHDNVVAFVGRAVKPTLPPSYLINGFSAATRRQMFALVQSRTIPGKEHLYQRLQQLLAQKLRNMPMCSKEIGSFLDNLISQGVVDDEEIYSRLRTFWHGTLVKRPEYIANQEDPTAYNTWRTTERLADIRKMLPYGFQPTNLLDVGCSEGSITAALGRGFQLQPSSIFGVDVRDLSGMEEGFTFTLYDGVALPYASNSISLAVALMSLHHVDDIRTTILEIKRVLVPGGYMAIREHDVEDFNLAPLIDVMHGMYARVWSDPAEMPEFCDHYKATYRSRLDWCHAFRECGFIQTATSPDRQPLKPSTGKWIKNPFRFYWGCWQKPK